MPQKREVLFAALGFSHGLQDFRNVQESLVPQAFSDEIARKQLLDNKTQSNVAISLTIPQ
jgi:hypothetical protein